MSLRSLLVPVLALTFGLMMASRSAGQELAPARTEAPSAASLFGARCIFCHGAAVTLAFSRKKLDAEGPNGLDAFLSGHHAPDDEARAAIVKFLLPPMADPG